MSSDNLAEKSINELVVHTINAFKERLLQKDIWNEEIEIILQKVETEYLEGSSSKVYAASNFGVSANRLQKKAPAKGSKFSSRNIKWIVHPEDAGYSYTLDLKNCKEGGYIKDTKAGKIIGQINDDGCSSLEDEDIAILISLGLAYRKDAF